MIPEEKGPVDRIEALKHKIYTAKDNVVRKTREGILHARKNVKVPDTWAPQIQKHVDTTAQLMSKPSLFKKFFIFSITFLAAAVVFAGFMFWDGDNTVSSENIVIEVLGNAFTPGGEELPLQISVTNKNAVALEFADIIVQYPKGSDSATVERKRIEVGTISSGKTVAENMDIVLFGEQGTERVIKITLEYRVRGATAIFTKEFSHTVTISNAPLVLSVEAPEDVSSNQDMTMRFKVAVNSTRPAENLMLRVEYPSGFIFSGGEPSPSLGNNVWLLGDLAQGGQKTIEVRGRLVGGDGEEKAFHAYAGEQDARDEAKIGVVYNSLVHTLGIKRPFIEAKLSVNDQTGDSVVVGSQGRVTAEIEWANNLPTRVDNLEIHARLSGSAFNESTVEALSGFYDSIQNEVVWDKNTTDEFKSVPPGESGRLSFSFIPSVNSAGVLVSDPTVSIEVSVKGTQPGEGNAIKEISNIEKMTVKVSSSFQLAIKALYSIGPFQNTGTLPPKAEMPTSYTIVWTATNSSNRMTNAEARTTLPTYVKWMGAVSPSSEDVTYVPATREVVWKIGTINQGVGFTTDPKEVAFQVELTPSLSQVGSVPILVNDTQVSGVDQFTNATIRATKQRISTRLSQDPNFVSGQETVIR